MTLSLPASRRTLADHVLPRRLATDVALVSAGAALTGLLAQVAVPLWPVPVTGQTLAVLLVGATLGANRGAISLALYAVLGVVGVPWFSDASAGWGVIAGPTGGYILGFVPAAYLAGMLAERRWDRKLAKALASFLAGSATVFVFGLPWLSATLGLDLAQTLEAGLYPFVLGGMIKAAIAAGLFRGAWLLHDRMAAGRDA